MKCPKCGTEIMDQGLWRGLIHNRIILVFASIAIAAILMTSTLLLLEASNLKPQLVGDLTSGYHYDWDGEGSYYIIQVHGYIYNTGPIGCFAVAIIKLSDNRGWTSETPVNLSWMPVNGVELVFEDIRSPATFSGENFDYETVNIELEYEFYDPMENDVYEL